MLPFPYAAKAKYWSRILGVPEDLIQEVLGIHDEIHWPEIYDWLVECEVVNLPIPMEMEEIKQKEKENLPGLFD